MRQAIQIVPSILSADFTRLGEQVLAAQRGGADQIHVDVMDGHFVPNITFGPLIVSALRRVTDLPLDVHLMISDPDRHLAAFAKVGASALTVHVETCTHIHRTIQTIHNLGLRAGVAINPGTPISHIEAIAPDVDLVLVMSVNPGFGGQAFIEHSPRRIEQARRLLDEVNPQADLAVDGGIDPHTVAQVVAAGANVLIAGSAIFESPLGIEAAIANLRVAALAAVR